MIVVPNSEHAYGTGASSFQRSLLGIDYGGQIRSGLAPCQHGQLLE